MLPTVGMFKFEGAKMAVLTSDQILWLKTQRILPSQMFDATGLSAKDRVRLMKENGFSFYFGGAHCGSGGHSLRTKAGHCIQCDTSKIVFQSRSTSPGYVYIAGSPRAQLVKVGMTIDIADRAGKLNDYAYGGAQDWELLVYAWTTDSGRCEFSTHAKLEQFGADGFYIRAGKKQVCYELFNCSYAIAKDALLSSIPNAAKVTLVNEARSKAFFPNMTPN